MGKKHKSQKDRRKEHDPVAAEIKSLSSRALADAPPSGSVARRDGKPPPRMFEDVALSSPTQSGLERGKFKRMTRIQQLAIPHALAGRDILGAARTGSGKTLAFVVPMFETLYRARWGSGHGVGGMVISPTRELALQIFEVVKVVGYRHSIVAGLVIGGSSFSKEQAHVHQIGVMICTPGRVLQHLEQSPTMDASQVQVLVLDEADRLLDMGFKEQLKQIIDYLPRERQTLLFSATQTKSVKALASLSLNKPEYVSVVYGNSENPQDDKNNEVSEEAQKVALQRVPTPVNLMQAYSVVQLPDKLDVLFSFIRSHLQSKIIVFFSSCKQVKYVDSAFRKLRPGIPLMSIHGKIKQQKRMYIYYDFIKKPAAVLFATDIAARGLDFPSVDWVVQADAPENVASYIHRVGRTARYKSRGRALLMLLPNEASGMVPLLRDANIPIVEKRVNPSKQQSIQRKLQSQLASDTELKMQAQRAFKSYLRSVHLQPDKRVFHVDKLPMKAFAQSLGLLNTPRIKIAGVGGDAGRSEHRAKKNVPHEMAKLNALMEEDNESGRDDRSDDEDDQDEDVLKLLESLKSTRRHKAKKSKVERLLELKASSAVSKAQLSALERASDDELDRDEEDVSGDSDDDGLIFKQSQKPFDEQQDEDQEELTDISKVASKKQLKKLRINPDGVAKGRAKPSRKMFDDFGEEQSPFAKLADELGSSSTNPGETVVKASSGDRQAYLEQMRAKLAGEDAKDKVRERERVKAKRLEAKIKLREERIASEEAAGRGGGGAVLASGSESEASDSDAEGNDSDSAESSVSSVEETSNKRSRSDTAKPDTRSQKRSKVLDTEAMQAEALRLIASQGV